MTGGMVFGWFIPANSFATDPARLRDMVQTAEGAGLDSIWMNDHLVVPAHIESPYPYNTTGKIGIGPPSPFLEPLTFLSFVAGCTQRVRLGTFVYIVPYRHPVVTAKIVTTLDNLSGGRLDFGVGVGWMKEEFQALGYDFHQRGAMTDEQLRAMKILWTEVEASFQGKFYSFERIGAAPRPYQRPYPPIWVGGHSRAALRRTGQFGDGWIPLVSGPPEMTPGDVAGHLATIRADAIAAGRDPSAIKVYLQAGLNLTDTRSDPTVHRRPFSGNLDEVIADLAAYHSVGTDGIVFSFGPADQYAATIRRFADRVLPAFRGRTA